MLYPMITALLERQGSRAFVAALIAAVCVFAALLTSSATADPTGTTGATATPTLQAAAKKKSKKPSGKQPAFKITAEGAYRYRGTNYVFPRGKVVLRANVKADFEGQDVTLVVSRNGIVVKKLKLRAEDAKNGRSEIHARWRTGKKGKYTVVIELSHDQKALADPGHTAKISVARGDIHRGSRGVSVRLYQSKLAKLGFVVPRNGRFDAATARASMAFRKANGLARIFTAGKGVIRKLAADAGRGFPLRFPGAGRHVEVDISKQLMAFASGGKVTRIYHVSTGAPGTPTIRGTYRVYRKDWGTNAKGMVNSSYFIRGYAIHGYADVPPYNASHGCVRVPVPSAASIYNWIKYGTRVDTYY